MMIMKYLARKGSVGGTARWVAKAFFAALAEGVINIDNCATQTGLRGEIEKVVHFALAARFHFNPQHKHAQEILREYQNGAPKGLLGFTISILAVEAGYYENTVENITMFDEVIAEELRRKHVGEAMISGNVTR